MGTASNFGLLGMDTACLGNATSRLEIFEGRLVLVRLVVPARKLRPRDPEIRMEELGTYDGPDAVVRRSGVHRVVVFVAESAAGPILRGAIALIGARADALAQRGLGNVHAVALLVVNGERRVRGLLRFDACPRHAEEDQIGWEFGAGHGVLKPGLPSSNRRKRLQRHPRRIC